MVIVVSDGSTDNTAAVARAAGAEVIELKTNQGKGGAMAAGVRYTKAPIIVFLDADLEGLEARHVDGIIRPVAEGLCDQCVGIFRHGKGSSEFAMRVSPGLSGQRAMRRELFESIPYVAEVRFGVEVLLNNAARKRKARTRRIILHGVSNTHKEQKLGLAKGMAARARMYKEIGQAMVKTRRRPAPKPWRKPWV